MDDSGIQDNELEENMAQDTSVKDEEMLSTPIQEQDMPASLCYHANQQESFHLSLPKTGGHQNRKLIILDGWKIAQRFHNGKQVYDYERVARAVQYFRHRGHRNLILCLPGWMKPDQRVEYYAKGIHYLIQLEKVLGDFLVYTPSEAREASFMEKLAKQNYGLIVTQVGPDTWSEQTKRILPFVFINGSFMLPEDPWGENGPSLPDLLCSQMDIQRDRIVNEVEYLMKQWDCYSEIKELRGLTLSLSEEEGKDLPCLIIDGSNVAMSHGLNVFYSCLGIYLAVQHFWNDKYYRNITVFVPNWRKNSKYTVYGHKYLDELCKRGLVCPCPSLSHDDPFILEEAKAKNGWILTNDKFRDFGPEWKDTKQRCIPFKFDENKFTPELTSSEAIGKSSVQPIEMD